MACLCCCLVRRQSHSPLVVKTRFRILSSFTACGPLKRCAIVVISTSSFSLDFSEYWTERRPVIIRCCLLCEMARINVYLLEIRTQIWGTLFSSCWASSTAVGRSFTSFLLVSLLWAQYAEIHEMMEHLAARTSNQTQAYLGLQFECHKSLICFSRNCFLFLGLFGCRASDEWPFHQVPSNLSHAYARL